MSKVRAGLLTLALVAGSGAALSSTAAVAAPPEADASSATQGSAAGFSDELPNPSEDKRRALRDVAIRQVLNGEATVEQRGNSKVVKVGETSTSSSAKTAAQSQYAEVARTGTDKIFVVLAEFGNDRATDIDEQYADQDTDPATPGPARFDGPLHNEIPEPDRSVDNSTVWQPDYDAGYYQQLYFGTGDDVESLATYYDAQSSGQYTVDGIVTDWVKVNYNEARYGRSNGFPCTGNVCSNTWYLLSDAIDVWVQEQYDAGMTDEDIAAELASFDVWDRYDFDGDGNFDESDGYIDHFQIVHSGGDQADGDPYQGEDAIWSHRWKAFQGTGEGPADFPDGGAEIGDTGLWVADYTIQPENGGLSVFTHEYGHDLGLPDLYDTASGAGESVGWWSLMAQSRLSAEGDQGIGTRPGDLGAWEKLQLGWLDYSIVTPDDRRKVNLGPHELQTDDAQALVVLLPDKEVSTSLGDTFAGDYQWWSGGGDDYTATMSQEVVLPAGDASFDFQARWNIEDCGPDPCDYAYVEVDDGSGWTVVPGSITLPDEGDGIDGLQEEWTPATFDISAYAGSTIQLRVRYSTDGAAQGFDPNQPSGIFLDELVVTANGDVLLSDGAEDADGGWTVDDFTRVTAVQTETFDNYYLASNRQYVGYDKYLQSGPYNFGFADTRPDFVEHFPLQDGLLISYWDTSYTDNNTSTHPGRGEILPIDAHPQPIYRLDGAPWRGRIGLYDAPFTLEDADSFELHFNSEPSYINGEEGRAVFNDRRSFWNKETSTGVKLPDNDVRMRVLEEDGDTVKLRIRPSNR